MSARRVDYTPRIGLADAVLLVIGGVVGGGIYFTPPKVAARCGSMEITLAAWVAGGVISLAGAFCFAELGSRFPAAGGSYVYLREGFGRLVAFLQGWSILLVSGAGSMAAIATFCGMNFLALAGRKDADPRPVAVAAITLLTALNCLGVKPGARVQSLLTVLKVAILGALVGVAFTSPAGVAAPAAAGAPAPVTALAFLAALGPVLFAYGGWQMANCVAAEIEDAPRQLPRALLAGVGAVTLIYLAMNGAYLRALTYPGLAGAGLPAMNVMGGSFGGWGATLVNLGMAISTLGFLSATILTLPRMYQAMAADGAFVAGLAALHPEHRTPVRAILLQSAVAIVLCASTLTQLIDYVVFGDWLFMTLTALALLKVRASGKTPEYTAPGGAALPLAFALVAASVVVGSTSADYKPSLIAAGFIASGIPVYFLWRRA